VTGVTLEASAPLTQLLFESGCEKVTADGALLCTVNLPEVVTTPSSARHARISR
jgi:PIN domain nuclease of toxin-antitoxin system